MAAAALARAVEGRQVQGGCDGGEGIETMEVRQNGGGLVTEDVRSSSHIF